MAKPQNMPTNREIIATTVRLVTSEGSTLVTLQRALDRASQTGVDLVQFTDSNPPIVKILDYARYKYDAARKAKLAKKQQRKSKVELKELRFRPVTGENDLKRLIKKANDFFADGHQVKLVCRFRGRENAFRPQGFAILDTILKEVNGEPQGNVNSAARDINIILVPA